MSRTCTFCVWPVLIKMGFFIYFKTNPIILHSESSTWHVSSVEKDLSTKGLRLHQVLLNVASYSETKLPASIGIETGNLGRDRPQTLPVKALLYRWDTFRYLQDMSMLGRICRMEIFFFFVIWVPVCWARFPNFWWKWVKSLAPHFSSPIVCHLLLCSGNCNIL